MRLKCALLRRTFPPRDTLCIMLCSTVRYRSASCKFDHKDCFALPLLTPPPLHQIGLGDCLDLTWEVTDSFFGGSHGVPADERCRINRAYARVSRDKMQANLKARLSAAGVRKIKGRVDAKTVRFFTIFVGIFFSFCFFRASFFRSPPPVCFPGTWPRGCIPLHTATTSRTAAVYVRTTPAVGSRGGYRCMCDTRTLRRSNGEMA